jgi:hypothetical protein
MEFQFRQWEVIAIILYSTLLLTLLIRFWHQIGKCCLGKSKRYTNQLNLIGTTLLITSAGINVSYYTNCIYVADKRLTCVPMLSNRVSEVYRVLAVFQGIAYSIETYLSLSRHQKTISLTDRLATKRIRLMMHSIAFIVYTSLATVTFVNYMNNVVQF